MHLRLKLNLFTCLLLSSSMALAQTERVVTHDINKNGKPDRFEYFLGDKLIRFEEDRNGDGKIDFKVLLNHSGYYRIEHQDANFDGKFERKKSFKLLPKNKSRVTTEVDRNYDGVFEVKYHETEDNHQKQDASGCDLKIVDAKIDELSKMSLEAVAATDDGLLPTGLGYRIDSECYKKWGDGLNEVVKDTVQTGLQCLVDLDKKSSDGKTLTGAGRNAFDLTKLMENDGIAMVCSEEDGYEWDGIAGHASTTPGQTLKTDILHPFVSINPNDPKNKPADIKETNEFKMTIFHETLHNLGYKHGHGIEYPYSCETCCLSTTASVELKDQACKICTGNYKNESDIAYVKDYLIFSQLNYQEAEGVKIVTKYIKENPKSVTGISMLAFANTGTFNPIGEELSKIISAKGLPLTEEDKQFLANARTREEWSNRPLAAQTSKSVANALYELYYSQDAEKALAYLDENKEAIEKELMAMKNNPTDVDSKYMYNEIRKQLDDLIDDVWLNGYPSGVTEENPTSDKAYELFQFFDPDKAQKEKDKKDGKVKF